VGGKLAAQELRSVCSFSAEPAERSAPAPPRPTRPGAALLDGRPVFRLPSPARAAARELADEAEARPVFRAGSAPSLLRAALEDLLVARRAARGARSPARSPRSAAQPRGKRGTRRTFRPRLPLQSLSPRSRVSRGARRSEDVRAHLCKPQPTSLTVPLVLRCPPPCSHALTVFVPLGSNMSESVAASASTCAKLYADLQVCLGPGPPG